MVMSSTRKLYSLSLVSTSRTDVAGARITYIRRYHHHHQQQQQQQQQQTV